MQTVSAGFLAARKTAGTRVRRVYLSTAGGAWAEVSATDYTVTAARGERRVARYEGTVTLSDPSVVVDEFRTRVRIRAGFVVNDVEELVTITTSTVYDVDRDDHGKTVLSFYSNELAVEEAEFWFPQALPEATAVSTIVQLLSVVPADVFIRASQTTLRIPATVYERERWQAIADIAQGMSAEVHSGPDGSWVIDRVPTLADPPVFTLTDTQTGLAEKRSRKGVPSVVVVWGNRISPDIAPPRGQWVDLIPSSKTYVHGPYGEVVEHVESSILTDQPACDAAAYTIGMNKQGAARSVSMDAAPADFLEPGDVVTVIGLSGMPENHILDSVTHSSQGAQKFQTRTTAG